jgi:thiamine biosynthesis protein ThiI
VLRCPELTLKGRNRGLFERQLVRNVTHRLAHHGLKWTVRLAHGRLYVNVGAGSPGTVAEVVQSLCEIAGVESVSPTIWLRSARTRQETSSFDRALIEKTVVELAEERFVEGGTFAVRVNRVDKRFAMKSIDMEHWLGQAVRDGTRWSHVDLSSPTCLISVDIYGDGMYFQAGKLPGVGGLPIGTGGRVLALLSGGIDSPVAAFELARRGSRVDFFHLSATHGQQRNDDASVVRLARTLSRYTQRSRLYTAPATHLDLALTGPATGFEAIIFRRFLVRSASILAETIGAKALVIGDSVGQVASQTLENLATVYRATERPILTPLIGSNKQETIDKARRIGTYEISIEPYKDCCALLALSPKTRSLPREIESLERRYLDDYQGLIEKTLDDLVWRTFDCGRAADQWQVSSEAIPIGGQRTTTG